MENNAKEIAEQLVMKFIHLIVEEDKCLKPTRKEKAKAYALISWQVRQDFMEEIRIPKMTDDWLLWQDVKKEIENL